MTKNLLLLTCATSALGLWAGAAQAATDQAATTDASQATVGELVVFAEHRETALQKIPVAVSVFTGKQRDLIGISSVADVTNYAPGFSYDPVTTHAYLRGVGRQSINITDENRVATYENEFYVYSPYNLALSSLFLSQEQIQRGPQNVGGRNAEGGSIDMISVRPTDKPYAELRATVGNFGVYTIEGAASGQIAPGLDVRVAGFDKNQNIGYYNNVAGGKTEGNVLHEWYIEGQADWKPSDKFELWMRGFLENWNDRGDAGSRAGYASGSWDETNLSDPNIFAGAALFVNPNYGYAARPGSLTQIAAQNGPDKAQVPIGVTLANPNIFNNPSTSNPNTFAAPGSRTVKLNNFDNFDYIATYNLGDSEIKYTGGIQGYDYDLNYPWVDTDVLNYTLPGSSTNGATVGALNNISATLAGFGLLPAGSTGAFPGCAAGSILCGGPGSAAKPAAGALPGTSTLQINPNANLLYIEDDWWTAHDLSWQSTSDAPLQWIVGGFFYHQHYDNPIELTDPQQTQLLHPLTPAGLPGPISVPGIGVVGFTAPGALAAPNPLGFVFYNDYKFDVNSLAGYGQFSYKFNDQFKFTGNFRYSWDSKQGVESARFVAFNNTVIDGFAPFFGAATPSEDATLGVACPTGVLASCFSGALAPGVKSFTLPTSTNGFVTRKLGGTSAAPTGGAGIEWTPTPDIFTYARYSRGYQSLSFSAGSVGLAPEVQPEYLNSYEVGYKQNFGHTLTLDVAAFYYDYIDLQLPISALAPDGKTTVGRFINVPKAESAGIEVEGSWVPVKDLVMTLSYAYDYSQLKTGCFGTVANGVLTPNANALCLLDTQDPDAVAAGARPFPGQTFPGARLQSVNGDALPQTPRNKVAFSVAYTFHFDPGDLSLEGSYAYRDSQEANVFSRFYNVAPAWNDVDLRALWRGPHDRYEVIGYVRNLFNTLNYDVPASGAGLAGTNQVTHSAAAGLLYENVYELGPPRTFGLEVRYKFF